MKILFAVNNDNVLDAIVKKYQKDYKEILSYIFDKQWFVFAWIKNIKSINVLIILQMLSVTL